MKKSLILLLVIIAGIFIAGCAMDTVSFCPYCASLNIKTVEPGVYQCGRVECGKTFGAKLINE
jgi:hypothetical protein